MAHEPNTNGKDEDDICNNLKVYVSYSFKPLNCSKINTCISINILLRTLKILNNMSPDIIVKHCIS